MEFRDRGYALLLCVLTISGVVPGLRAESMDVLVTGGLLFDGSGAEPVYADVGIDDGRIVFVGKDAKRSADVVVDASGQWVTPGFIDAHSHAELDEDYGRDALPYLYQGITTAALGLDGSGLPEVDDRLTHWRQQGIGINGLLFVGHGAVRRQVMGEADRPPTPKEFETMQALIRQAMREGAFGLSTGLFYVPGTYASTEEVIALAQVAAEFQNAIYDTHDRDLGAVYQGVGYDASVREGLRIIEESGLRGIFSHYNLQGAHNFGRATIGAALVNDARTRGVDVWAAQHPYTATQSSLRAYTIPGWAAAGGLEAMIARFDDPAVGQQIALATDAMLAIRGGAEKIRFVDPDPSLNGKTLAEKSAELGLPAALAAQAILRGGNRGVMNLDLYDDANTRRLAQEPWMMTCTDGRTPRPDQPITHPRTFGAFPKKMRMFVFDEPLLSPSFVVRSFSGLAADFYRLPHRGYLREGYAADLVVLDPETYRDKASFTDPRQYATGVHTVLVNGEFAIRDGAPTGALAGEALLRP
jgi:N-acyl-D-amino-acid deacylase